MYYSPSGTLYWIVCITIKIKFTWRNRCSAAGQSGFGGHRLGTVQLSVQHLPLARLAGHAAHVWVLDEGRVMVVLAGALSLTLSLSFSLILILSLLLPHPRPQRSGAAEATGYGDAGASDAGASDRGTVCERGMS